MFVAKAEARGSQWPKNGGEGTNRRLFDSSGATIPVSMDIAEGEYTCCCSCSSWSSISARRSTWDADPAQVLHGHKTRLVKRNGGKANIVCRGGGGR